MGFNEWMQIYIGKPSKLSFTLSGLGKLVEAKVITSEL